MTGDPDIEVQVTAEIDAVLPLPMPAASNRPSQLTRFVYSEPGQPDASIGATKSSTTFTYREAMRKTIATPVTHDDRVFLIGKNIGAYGGSFAVSFGLFEDFGARAKSSIPALEVGVRRSSDRHGARRNTVDRRDHDRELSLLTRPDHGRRRDAAAHVRRDNSMCPC